MVTRNVKRTVRSRGDAAFDAAVVLITLMITLLLLYPLYFTVIASFSEPHEVVKGNVFLWPKGFTLEAYKYMLEEKSIWTGYANSIIYTVCGTLYNVLLTIPAAYVLSKKDLPGRMLFTWFFFITMYFGGGLVPSYLLYRDMGLLNTRWAMILGTGVSCWNLIVCRQFFTASIPDELYEAAAIDGSTELRSFFGIALPLSGAMIAIMVLFYGVGHWNSYFNALVYLTKSRLHPLQLVLRRILIQNQDMANQIATQDMSGAEVESLTRRTYLAYAMKYALILISSAPLLIAYPFVQKQFVKGVMIGALKG